MESFDAGGDADYGDDDNDDDDRVSVKETSSLKNSFGLS